MQPASPYIKTSDSDEDPVYDVPPNRHLFPEEENSDHVSKLVTLAGKTFLQRALSIYNLFVHTPRLLDL